MTAPAPATATGTGTGASTAAGSGPGPGSGHRLVDRLSLRVLLVGTMLLLVLTGLLASGAAVAVTMRAQLVDRVDEQLHDAAGGWAHRRPPDANPSALAPPNAPGTAPGATQGPTTGVERGPERSSRARPPSQFFVREVDASGAVVLTVNDDEHTPDVPADLVPGRPTTVPSLDGGGDWRVLSVPTATGTTVLGLPLDRTVDRTVTLLVAVSAAVGAVVLLLVGLAGWYLVSRSLRPLREVEATAGEIAAGNLDRRLPDRPVGTEVGGLTHSFNEMVTRIQRAFADTEASEEAARLSEERTRRFAADASHELRTPLTSIRGFAELHRMGAMPDADAALQRIESEAVRMSGLVEDLLTLARLDDERPMENRPIDVAELVTDAVATVRATDPAREVLLAVDAVPVVVGDEQRLRQVVVNLVANAFTHTPPGARVWVTVDRGGDDALVEVRDDGEGMGAEDAAHAFDRFHRADESRTRAAGGGSGLGLSIVQGIVRGHGGTVTLDTAPGAGASFTVRLPLQDAGGSAEGVGVDGV